jgi:arylsulfatase A-like enzyme
VQGRRSAPRRALVLALLLAVAAVGCPGSRRQPNLLFVTLDTTRADHLQPYGYTLATSPGLARLAEQGVVFEQAHSHVASTLPSHATMFTGLLPPSHSVRCNGRFRLPQAVPTLAEILSQAGWATGAVLGAFPLEHRFGLARGFDVYDDDFSVSAVTAARQAGRMDRPGGWLGHEYLDFERGADEVTDRALAWIGRQGRPWFLFAHYFDAHWPYEAPAAEAARFRLPYDAEIAYMDRHVARLVETVLREDPRTLVIITADHGESLGEHGEAWHNRHVYEATNHVPLLMLWPGRIEAGRREALEVGLADVLPTILDLFGLAAPARLDGRSLAGLFGVGVPPQPAPVYLETLVGSLEEGRGREVRGMLETGRKVIARTIAGRRGARWEYYDLAADPGELRSLADVADEDFLRRRDRLIQWSQRLEREAPVRQPLQLDQGAVERLRALGYL